MPREEGQPMQELNAYGDPIPTEEELQGIRDWYQSIIDSLSNPTPEIVADLLNQCSAVIQILTIREFSTTDQKT